MKEDIENVALRVFWTSSVRGHAEVAPRVEETGRAVTLDDGGY